VTDFSSLAMSYSPMGPGRRRIIKALEVNPFAISHDGG